MSKNWNKWASGYWIVWPSSWSNPWVHYIKNIHAKCNKREIIKGFGCCWEIQKSLYLQFYITIWLVTFERAWGWTLSPHWLLSDLCGKLSPDVNIEPADQTARQPQQQMGETYSNGTSSYSLIFPLATFIFSQSCLGQQMAIFISPSAGWEVAQDGVLNIKLIIFICVPKT